MESPDRGEKGCGPVLCDHCTINRTCLDSYGIKKRKVTRAERAREKGETWSVAMEALQEQLDAGARTFEEVVTPTTGKNAGVSFTRSMIRVPDKGSWQLDDPMSPYPKQEVHWEPSCRFCVFGLGGKCSQRIQKNDPIWIEMEEEEEDPPPTRGMMPKDVFLWLSSIPKEKRECYSCELKHSCTDSIWMREYFRRHKEWHPCPHTDESMATGVLQEQGLLEKPITEYALDERRICIECDRICDHRRILQAAALEKVRKRKGALSDPDVWETCPWDRTDRWEVQRRFRQAEAPGAEVTRKGVCKKFVHIKLFQRRTKTHGEPYNAFRDYEWILEVIDDPTRKEERRREILVRMLDGLQIKERMTTVKDEKSGRTRKILVERQGFSYLPYDHPYIKNQEKRKTLIANTLKSLEKEVSWRIAMLTGRTNDARTRFIERIEARILWLKEKLRATQVNKIETIRSSTHRK